MNVRSEIALRDATFLLPPQPLLSTMEEFDVHPLYDHAQILGQTMIQRDRLELALAAVAGAGLGGIIGIVLGHEALGVLIWALVGAVVVSGIVYCLRFFRH